MAGAGPSTEQCQTLLLLQPSRHVSTRFYEDFQSVHHAAEGVVKMYETRLRELNPNSTSITYEVKSLFQYLDDMKEVVALVWDKGIQGYKRHDRAWLKSQVQTYLASQR